MSISPEMIPVMPQYQRSPRANVFAAVFPGGQLLVEPARVRRYPGLLGAAPDTRALYGAAAQLLSGSARVLDFGCGSGIGAAELRCHFDEVTALDSDPRAVEFARAYLRSVQVLHDDGSQPIPDAERPDAVVIVDVLGQSPEPREVLRRARRWLAPGGRLFIAEPRACPSQALLPPVLRAFSRPGLVRLLSCTGLEVESWVEGAGNFIVCVARMGSDDFSALADADAALAAGRPELALQAYAEVSSEAPAEVRTEAMLGRADLLAAAGDLDAACRCVLDAATLSPGSARSLAGVSEVMFLTGDAPRAIEIAINALERDPCEPTAVQSLARAAGSARHEEAFASWRIANGLSPADLGVAIELSRMAAERGELPYAIWVLERVREFHAELGCDYHVTLAWLYLNAERAGDARLEAEIARVIDPESAAVSELLGQLPG